MTNYSSNIDLVLINTFITVLILVYFAMLFPYFLRGKKKDSNYFFYISVINIASATGNLILYGSYVIPLLLVIIGTITTVYAIFLRKQESYISNEETTEDIIEKR